MIKEIINNKKLNNLYCCKQCSIIFLRKDSRQNKFCSLDCSNLYSKIRGEKLKRKNIDNYNKNPNKCKKCDKDILCTYDKLLSEIKIKKFCNKSCSASFMNTGRNVSDTTKLKLKQYAVNNPSGFASPSYLNNRYTLPKKQYNLTCHDCNKNFTYHRADKKYCSKECTNKHIGGIRKGSGIGKSGWYKGFWCDSSYELAYMIYNLDNNIPISRNKKYFNYIDLNGKNKKYFPDFIVNNNYVEIKGYHTPEVDIKLNSVENITILYKNDLTHVFEHVKRKYNISMNTINSLYDYRQEETMVVSAA